VITTVLSPTVLNTVTEYQYYESLGFDTTWVLDGHCEFRTRNPDNPTYCPLLKRMQLTFTAWVVSFNTCDDEGGGGGHIDHVKNISPYHCVTFFPLVAICWPVITRLMSNLCTSLTTQNTTENNCIISHAQNTTALQSNLFLTGIHRLLVRNKGWSGFLIENNCQGQLQTPQSVLLSTTSVLYQIPEEHYL
jgi:hypothetical protein